MHKIAQEAFNDEIIKLASMEKYAFVAKLLGSLVGSSGFKKVLGWAGKDYVKRKEGVREVIKRHAMHKGERVPISGDHPTHKPLLAMPGTKRKALGEVAHNPADTTRFFKNPKKWTQEVIGNEAYRMKTYADDVGQHGFLKGTGKHLKRDFKEQMYYYKPGADGMERIYERSAPGKAIAGTLASGGGMAGLTLATNKKKYDAATGQETTRKGLRRVGHAAKDLLWATNPVLMTPVSMLTG